MNATTFTTIIPGLPVVEGQCTVKVDQFGNTSVNRLRAIQHTDMTDLAKKYLEKFANEINQQN